MTKTHRQMDVGYKYLQINGIIWLVCLNRLTVSLRTKWLWVRFHLQSLKLQIFGLFRARSPLTFRHLERRFTMKLVLDMRRTYSQIHRKDKYSELSSIIWPVWLSGWVFIYEQSGCGFESSWSHLNFRFGAFSEKELHWHSGNYRMLIHSETHTWHDKKHLVKCTLQISAHNSA